MAAQRAHPRVRQGTWTNHAARRKRKLLLHRAEIDKLAVKSQETGHTIVPLALYFKDGRAKVEIALARGKKEYDKRQTLREKQDRREIGPGDRGGARGGSERTGPTRGISLARRRWSRTMSGCTSPRVRCS